MLYVRHFTSVDVTYMSSYLRCTHMCLQMLPVGLLAMSCKGISEGTASLKLTGGKVGHVRPTNGHFPILYGTT